MVADIAAADDFITHFNTHPNIAGSRLEGGIDLGIDRMPMVLAPCAAKVMAKITVLVIPVAIAYPRRERQPFRQLALISNGRQYSVHHFARFLVPRRGVKSVCSETIGHVAADQG